MLNYYKNTAQKTCKPKIRNNGNQDIQFTYIYHDAPYSCHETIIFNEAQVPPTGL